MAEYNVDIQVRAKTQQATKGLTDIEAQVTGIIKKTEQAERSFNNLGKAVKGFGSFASGNVKAYGRSLSVLDKQLGGLGKRLGDVAQAFDFGGKTVVGVAGINALANAAAGLSGRFGGAVGALRDFGSGVADLTSPINAVTSALQAMGPAGMATAGGIAAATAAFMAFAPAAAKAVGPAAVRRVQELAGGFNRLDEEIRATATSFEDLIKDSTLNQLNQQLRDATNQLGEYRSNTEEAKISAQQLVAVTKAQAVEQRAINDLVRQAKGITQTELQEAKAVKSLATARKRKEFLKEEAAAAQESAKAIRAREQALADEARKNLAAQINQRKEALAAETQRVKEATRAAYEFARAQDVLADKRANAILETARQRRLAGATQYGPGGAGPATAAMAANVEAAAAVTAQNKAYADQAQKRIEWNKKVDGISTSLQKELNSLRVRHNAALYRLEQRRVDAIAKQEKQKAKETAAFRENLALGVGFPLLFGGGAGSVAGSAIGSFFGTGFGGQILGGAIGAQFDAAYQKAVALGNAVREINLDALKESGIAITGNLETQVELYKQLGQYAEAQALLAEQVTLQTGVFAESQQDVANSGNQLAAAWNDFTSTVSATIGLLATPFAAALTAALRIIDGIITAVNFVISGIGLAIKRVTEFTIELIAGEGALANMNAWMEMFNGKLDSSVLKARELFAQLNQRIISKDIELKFARQRRTGDSIQDQIANIVIDRDMALEQEFQDLVGKRVQVRKDLEKASAADLKLALEQLDAEHNRNNQLIKINAANKVTALQNREAAKQAREAATNAQRAANEYERSQKAGGQLLITLQKALNVAEARTPLEEDLAKAQNTYISYQERINDLLDEQQKIVLTAYNTDLLQLNNAKAYTDELKRQNEEFYKRAGLKAVDQLPAFAVPVDVQLAFGGQQLLGENEKLEKAKEELKELLDPINQVKVAAEGISGAFTDSFSKLIQGSMSAQEAMVNFFRRISDAFLDMAAQIITKMVVIKSLEMAIGIFGGGGLFNGAGPVQFPSGLNLGSSGFGFGTNILTGKALGGSVSAGSPYLVGERGPELFVPGAQGNIVPNNAMGGSNIVVNVDATGTQVQGDQPNANKLGEALGAAVRAELIRQKRPGGLLA